MEGFDLGRAHQEGPPDPGRAAREAADRIAEQVREILEHAEQRAGEIRSSAEADAEGIRRDAAEATARMLGSVDKLETQLEGYLTEFFEGIRGELTQLATRQEIDAAAAAFRAPEISAGPEDPEEPRFEPRPGAERPLHQVESVEPEPEPGPAPDEAEEPRRRRGLLRGRRERDPDPQPAPAMANGDADDAHVMALNMALNGTPRAETESYLTQRFSGLEDLGSILDDVYGRVKPR
jgi:hypothetical protein